MGAIQEPSTFSRYIPKSVLPVPERRWRLQWRQRRTAGPHLLLKQSSAGRKCMPRNSRKRTVVNCLRPIQRFPLGGRTETPDPDDLVADNIELAVLLAMRDIHRAISGDCASRSDSDWHRRWIAEEALTHLGYVLAFQTSDEVARRVLHHAIELGRCWERLQVMEKYDREIRTKNAGGRKRRNTRSKRAETRKRLCLRAYQELTSDPEREGLNNDKRAGEIAAERLGLKRPIAESTVRAYRTRKIVRG